MSDPDSSEAVDHEHLLDELDRLGISSDLAECLGGAIAETRLARYAAGDTLYLEGEDAEYLGIVRSGRIKLIDHSRSGRARIVRLHGPGSVLGLNGLLDEDSQHTAVAVDEVALYRIPIPSIRSIKQSNEETYCELMEYFSQYLRQADNWITEFSTGGVRGRVARLTQYLMSTDEKTGDDQVSLLTVEEMAEILGVTPESVSRVMADFKRKRVLVPLTSDSQPVFRCDARMLAREAES